MTIKAIFDFIVYMRYSVLAILASLLFLQTGWAQRDAYKVACIGFYNLENLFDTEDSPDTRDTEFTPTGSNRYTEDIYREKLSHLADVVAQLGTEVTPDGVAILGVCEVENRRVLEDFVAQPQIADRNYQIIHFDSRDHRGIDVALLYRRQYFTPTSARSIPMPTRIEDGDTSWSRDILLVVGALENDSVAILVNHWPSRRGGERATAPLRNRAASINKRLVDSLSGCGIKTIVMGDLNDDPVNESVSKILRAKARSERLGRKEMYNPMYQFYRKGIGTTAYRDAWSLFDQIILSRHFTNKEDGYYFYKARVFNEPFLTQKLGQYKGYPFRTYGGGVYLGGYSDHFPVYIFLVRKHSP